MWDHIPFPIEGIHSSLVFVQILVLQVCCSWDALPTDERLVCGAQELSNSYNLDLSFCVPTSIRFFSISVPQIWIRHTSLGLDCRFISHPSFTLCFLIKFSFFLLLHQGPGWEGVQGGGRSNRSCSAQESRQVAWLLRRGRLQVKCNLFIILWHLLFSV